MIRPDGSLTLIDYDGMFVPSMKGQTSPTIVNGNCECSIFGKK